MVVGYFHVRRLSVFPTENQAPLLIDSHAPEAFFSVFLHENSLITGESLPF
jgi:hypothetical protein